MSRKHEKMALWLSSAALTLAMVSPALAEEFDYDPGDTVYFTLPRASAGAAHQSQGHRADLDPGRVQ